MTITIPRTLEKHVKERAKKLDMTERQYVQTVLTQAVEADNALDDEAHMWMDASHRDATVFWKKHKL